MPFLRSALAIVLLAHGAAQAAGPALATVAPKTTVTAEDVQGEAILRIPPELREPTFARPESVKQLANNLVIRRVIADEAEAAGLLKDPVVQAAVRAARDRVLSEIVFADLDTKNKPKPEVVEAAARTFYNANPDRFTAPPMVGVSHILIRKETPDAKAKAEALLARIKGGADFGELARVHSEDAPTSMNGGMIGYIDPEQAAPEFAVAAMRLQNPGEISPNVVQTRFGFHIIRLDGRRAGGVRPFDDVKPALMRETEQRILMDKRREYSQRIQDKVKFDDKAMEAFAKKYESALQPKPATR